MASKKRVVDTAISMLVYNRVRQTIQCLESFEKADMSTAKLYVLDNGSTDGVTNFLRYFSNTDAANWYSYAISEVNQGVNEGRETVRQWILSENQNNKHLKYVVVLDSDVILTHRDWLKDAKKYLADNPDVAVVGAAGSNILPDFSRFVPAYSNPVHSVAGFCQVWRADVWKKLVYDPNFVKFWAEDSDACFQAQEMGLECHMIDIPVQHKSSHSGFGESQELWKRNMEYLKTKWEPKQVLRWRA